MLSAKMQKMNGPDWDRKVVCRRCGLVMLDMEPQMGNGEFWHGAMYTPKSRLTSRSACPNAGGTFDLTDTKEVAEFVRKRVRRAAKRAGTSV